MIIEFPRTPKAPALEPAQVQRLHLAASRSDHVLGRLVAIATVVGASAPQLAASRVERVDRMAGMIVVGDASGGEVEVALGFDGALAVQNAVADRRSGWLLPDDHGWPLDPDADAQAFAAELLERIDPGVDFPWTFRSVQECILGSMLDAGVDYAIVEAQAGLRALKGGSRFERVLSQRVAADWWTSRMGLRTISPFETLDLIRLAARRRRGAGPDPIGATDGEEAA